MYYADSSALVKLVVEETESAGFREWLLAHKPDVVASELARVEVIRAVSLCHPASVQRAVEILQRISIKRITTSICSTAARIPPLRLRSLDAIHLATALDFEDCLAGFICYDQGLSVAAAACGLKVLAPGSPSET